MAQVSSFYSIPFWGDEISTQSMKTYRRHFYQAPHSKMNVDVRRGQLSWLWRIPLRFEKAPLVPCFWCVWGEGGGFTLSFLHKQNNGRWGFESAFITKLRSATQFSFNVFNHFTIPKCTIRWHYIYSQIGKPSLLLQNLFVTTETL